MLANDNPSLARGLPNNGTLEGGINLPDNGTGYYHNPVGDPMDTDDWGTLALINVIEGTGRNWNETHTSSRMMFGDLSLQNGGYFPPHGSHRNGLDVDMRYVRNDGGEIGLNLKEDPAHYDQQGTQYLIDLFIERGNIVSIFTDVARSGLSGSVVVDDTAHYDHFHVRIDDPDGIGN